MAEFTIPCPVCKQVIRHECPEDAASPLVRAPHEQEGIRYNALQDWKRTTPKCRYGCDEDDPRECSGAGVRTGPCDCGCHE